jgi:hypothetical protein
MNKRAPSRRTRTAPRSTPKAQASGMDLAALFGAATQALTANQSALNQADTENQNHGDNMVQAFNMISQVMAGQKGSSPSDQLRSASQYLAQNGTSGSAHVYSQGLGQASEAFRGQSAVTPDNAMLLIQALLGGGGQAQPPSTQGGDLLGTLLGGGQQAQPPAAQGGDLLGALLGGAQGAPQGSQQQDGLDLGDVLNAGMAFMNAKQQGQDNMQAALTALMAAGPMGQKQHRQQSGQLVANALLQAVAGMANRR